MKTVSISNHNCFWPLLTYFYKLKHLRSKQVVLLIDGQQSSNPVRNLTLNNAVEMVRRLQFDLSEDTGSFSDHLLDINKVFWLL